MLSSANSEVVSDAAAPDLEAIVIGAGFAGLRMLYDLRERDISVRLFEDAPEVGGTWYWNAYPGAHTDSQSWIYQYSFSKELQDEWEPSERYTPQPEALAYLKHVTDRFDLRRYIQFNTRVTAAVYDETAALWRVRTSQGDDVTCRYLVSAVGPLSAPYKPEFPGIDDFQGEWYQTARWPQDREVDLSGKRVAVIGTGATAVQLIPLVAHMAAELTVFQRTPNYVLPARNGPLPKEQLTGIRTNYDKIWAQAKEQVFGFAMDPAGRSLSDVSSEEARRILEWGWEIGGFHFVFETFDDILTNDESNAVVSQFIRDKIRSIVKNPQTAELLCPTYPFFGRRPPLGHYYYETFNLPHVRLVDVSSQPITALTADGVQVGGETFAADVVIFATGFDAVTGSVTQIDIRGRNGISISEKWSNGPAAYLGMAVSGFPNMFTIFGPGTPFANAPVVVEDVSAWIADTIVHLRKEGISSIEATPEAETEWLGLLNAIVNATVLPQAQGNYLLGANIPGKTQTPLFYLAGVKPYRDTLLSVIDDGYRGFAFAGETREPVAAGAGVPA